MTPSGTTIPYAKVRTSAHVVSKESVHYQHYEPRLLREATPPDLSNPGDKGRLYAHPVREGWQGVRKQRERWISTEK